MGALEIGQALVKAVSSGREAEWRFVTDYYASNIVSIEGAGGEDMPQQVEGMDAIKQKHDWWYNNHEVHEVVATGPFVGHRADQFVIHFAMDATPGGGERSTMNEIALYTIADGKIVQEEYLYLMA